MIPEMPIYVQPVDVWIDLMYTLASSVGVLPQSHSAQQNCQRFEVNFFAQLHKKVHQHDLLVPSSVAILLSSSLTFYHSFLMICNNDVL